MGGRHKRLWYSAFKLKSTPTNYCGLSPKGNVLGIIVGYNYRHMSMFIPECNLLNACFQSNTVLLDKNRPIHSFTCIYIDSKGRILPQVPLCSIISKIKNNVIFQVRDVYRNTVISRPPKCYNIVNCSYLVGSIGLLWKGLLSNSSLFPDI